MFVILWQNSSEADLVLASEANRKFPQDVIKFYEKRIKIHKVHSNSNNSKKIKHRPRERYVLAGENEVQIISAGDFAFLGVTLNIQIFIYRCMYIIYRSAEHLSFMHSLQDRPLAERWVNRAKRAKSPAKQKSSPSFKMLSSLKSNGD